MYKAFYNGDFHLNVIRLWAINKVKGRLGRFSRLLIARPTWVQNLKRSDKRQLAIAWNSFLEWFVASKEKLAPDLVGRNMRDDCRDWTRSCLFFNPSPLRGCSDEINILPWAQSRAELDIVTFQYCAYLQPVHIFARQIEQTIFGEDIVQLCWLIPVGMSPLPHEMRKEWSNRPYKLCSQFLDWHRLLA